MSADRPLTDRQQEVLDLLNAGLSAPEVGKALGITRNAVYQFIGALIAKGALPEGWTPSGERRLKPGEQAADVSHDAADMADALYDTANMLEALNEHVVAIEQKLDRLMKHLGV